MGAILGDEAKLKGSIGAKLWWKAKLGDEMCPLFET